MYENPMLMAECKCGHTKNEENNCDGTHKILKKKTYKCDSCNTVIKIETETHDLHDVITCPCDQPMQSVGK